MPEQLEFYTALDRTDPQRIKDFLLNPQGDTSKALIALSKKPGIEVELNRKILELSQSFKDVRCEQLGVIDNNEFLATGYVFVPTNTKDSHSTLATAITGKSYNVAGLCEGNGVKYPFHAKSEEEYQASLNAIENRTQSFINWAQNCTEDIITTQDFPFDLSQKYSQEIVRNLTNIGFGVIVQSYLTEENSKRRYKGSNSCLLTLIRMNNENSSIKYIGTVPNYQTVGESNINGVAAWETTYPYEKIEPQGSISIDRLAVGQTTIVVAEINGVICTIGNTYNIPTTSRNDRSATISDAARNVSILSRRFTLPTKNLVTLLVGDINPYGFDLNKKFFGLHPSPIKHGINLLEYLLTGSNISNINEVKKIELEIMKKYGSKIIQKHKGQYEPTLTFRRFQSLFSNTPFGYFLDVVITPMEAESETVEPPTLTDHECIQYSVIPMSPEEYKNIYGYPHAHI